MCVFTHIFKVEHKPANNPLVILFICSNSVSRNTEILLPVRPNVVIVQHVPKNLLTHNILEITLISASEASYNNIWEVEKCFCTFFSIFGSYRVKSRKLYAQKNPDEWNCATPESKHISFGYLSQRGIDVGGCVTFKPEESTKVMSSFMGLCSHLVVRLNTWHKQPKH